MNEDIMGYLINYEGSFQDPIQEFTNLKSLIPSFQRRRSVIFCDLVLNHFGKLAPALISISRDTLICRELLEAIPSNKNYHSSVLSLSIQRRRSGLWKEDASVSASPVVCGWYHCSFLSNWFNVLHENSMEKPVVSLNPWIKKWTIRYDWLLTVVAHSSYTVRLNRIAL